MATEYPKVTVTDNTGRELCIDSVACGLKIIDTEHAEVHEGEHYCVSHYDSDTDTDGTVIVHCITPDTAARIHVIFSVEVSSHALFEIYENPTTSNNGTALTAYNSDRNSANTTTSLWFHTPTVSNAGTLLLTRVLGSSGANPTGARGSALSRGDEFILKQNEQYLFRVTALVDNVKCALDMQFYEE